MRTLFDYGFENYEYRTLEIDIEEYNETVPVKNAKGDYYKETIYAQFELSLDDTKRLLKQDDAYYGKVILPKSLEAPLKEGDVIGTFEIYINDTVAETREIKMAHDVVELDFLTKIHQILRYFIDKICRNPIEIT